MNDDRFKDAGEFHPDKAWSKIQRKDRERAEAAPTPPPIPVAARVKKAAGTAWKVFKYSCLTVAGLIGLALLWAFHTAYPAVGQSIATVIMFFFGIYLVTTIIMTNKKIDVLHEELKQLRYDFNNHRNRL